MRARPRARLQAFCSPRPHVFTTLRYRCSGVGVAMLNWAEIEAQEEIADIATHLPTYLHHLTRDGTWVRYDDVNSKGGAKPPPLSRAARGYWLARIAGAHQA